MVRWGSRPEAGAIGGDVVRWQQSVGLRAVLLDEPASTGGGAKERHAAPLSLACPKTNVNKRNPAPQRSLSRASAVRVESPNTRTHARAERIR